MLISQEHEIRMGPTVKLREKKRVEFRPYRAGRTLCPVTVVTPPDEPFIHTFFDVSPWSPSGRYLLCMQLPYEDREPQVGDAAGVCVIDLEERTIECVYETRGWAMQLAAHQQWGTTDRHAYLNDADGDRVFTVELDLEDGNHRRLDGPLYMLSPDGGTVLGPSLTEINLVQKGYGVPIDARTARLPDPGPSPARGLWKTDVASGESSLLLSFAEMVERLPELGGRPEDMYFFFHTKYNPAGDRIMQVHTSYSFAGGTRSNGNHCVITFRPDLSDMHVALPTDRWALGGHHPNWHPDGGRITMNIRADGEIMRFCEFGYDGSGFRVFSPELAGGGHPALTADGRYLVTDAYVEEPIALKNDETPIRICGVDTPFERHICTIRTICDATRHLDPEKPPARASETLIDRVSHKQSALDIFRLDPHPAWNRDFTQVCFGGAPEGKRQLLVADVREIVR